MKYHILLCTLSLCFSGIQIYPMAGGSTEQPSLKGKAKTEVPTNTTSEAGPVDEKKIQFPSVRFINTSDGKEVLFPKEIGKLIQLCKELHEDFPEKCELSLDIRMQFSSAELEQVQTLLQQLLQDSNFDLANACQRLPIALVLNILKLCDYLHVDYRAQEQEETFTQKIEQSLVNTFNTPEFFINLIQDPALIASISSLPVPIKEVLKHRMYSTYEKIFGSCYSKHMKVISHKGSTISCTQFSPSGKLLAVGTDSGQMHIWSCAKGELLHTFDHGKKIRFITWTPDNNCIATTSTTEVKLWHMHTEKLLQVFNHKKRINSVSFSPNGSYLLTSSGNQAIVWETQTGKQHLFNHGAEVFDASWHPNGSKIVTACADHMARIWNITNQALVMNLNGHTRTVSSARFSPDGTRIITGSYDCTARIWSTESGQGFIILDNYSESEIHEHHHVGHVYDAVYSGAGNCVVTLSMQETTTIRIWNSQTGKFIHGFKCDIKNPHTVDIATHIYTKGTDTYLSLANTFVSTTIHGQIVNAKTGKAIATLSSGSMLFSQHNPKPFAMISADGSYALASLDPSTIRLWCLNDYSLEQELLVMLLCHVHTKQSKLKLNSEKNQHLKTIYDSISGSQKEYLAQKYPALQKEGLGDFIKALFFNRQP